MKTLDTVEIMKLLPHRHPMMMVDRVLDYDERRIVGVKNVASNEPCFQGHFPGNPIMPGVLQLEAMAQTGGILLILQKCHGPLTPYLVTIDKAKFRRAVRPGDVMRIEVEILNLRSTSVRFRGEVLVDGELAAEAEIMCMVEMGGAAG